MAASTGFTEEEGGGGAPKLNPDEEEGAGGAETSFFDSDGIGVDPKENDGVEEIGAGSGCFDSEAVELEPKENPPEGFVDS